MPTFGEYETVGDPIATAEERSHASTVWRAVRPGASDGREYVVKCYAPRLRGTSRSTETETLSRDRGLEFLDGIKEQKRAQAAGGRSLAPVHEFGIADAGAWYVTDYYPRANLKAWIAKKGRVDSAGLRYVVAQLVAGCLALKRARGYSHGNLKVSNAFRAGKTGTFQQTPILLTDPYPAGPARELDSPNTELLGRVMEAEDLRAIGEVLLQLVEGRLLTSSEDYNWPIAPSPAWKNLGKDGDRWLQLCNQLLDGNRSPEALNLETLANEFRPSVGKGKLVLTVAATVVAVCVLGGGFYAIMAGRATRKLAKFEADLQAARDARNVTNLAVAITKVNAALERQRDNPKALALKSEIDAAIEREFVAAIQSADAKLTAYTPESLNAAEQFLKSAEELKRQDPRVSDLRGRIAKARQDFQAETRRKQLVDALVNYLKQGDAEAQAGSPNWLQASNFYALAATNAALLNDATNRKLAESGLTKAVSAIQAQSGEQRLGDEVKRLLTQAREAGRTNNWQAAVNLLTEAGDKAKGLTKNPISVAAELAAARRNLTEWQGKEAGRKVIGDLILQGDAGVNAANWPSASNYFAQALTNAVRLPDPQLAESARQKLQSTIQKLEEQKAQLVAAANKQKEDNAYNDAVKALEAGSFSQARNLGSGFSSSRFTVLVQRINTEETLWKAMSNHLALAQYDAILNASNLPTNKLFSDIKTAATKEKKVFDVADREFKAGTTNTDGFHFLASSEFTSLTDKPVFSKLALDARAELLQTRKATDLSRTNIAEARAFLTGPELRSKASKEPFKTLAANLDKLEASIQQAESAFLELVKTAETNLVAGKFAEAKAKGNEALKSYPSVRDRSAASNVVIRAEFQLTRAGALTSATKALAGGEYAAVATLCAKYPTDEEFIAIAKTATDENKALKTYEENFVAADYDFITKLQGKTNYTSKQPFSKLLEDAINEKAFLSSLESLKTSNNWSGVLSKSAGDTFSAVRTKKPFSDLYAWAIGQKGAADTALKTSISSLDAKLEVLLVQYNVLRSNDPKITTTSGRQARRLTDVSYQQKDYDLKQVKSLEAEYRRLGVINEQSRNDQIVKLTNLIPKYGN